jgi:lysocardiolipin and lysophospholipid acyltransferase
MYGPTMDLFQFLFLARDWIRDQAEISRLWAHFARLHWPVQLMLFPEGTDFNPKSVDKSRAFTDARNERPFKHVLAPRVAGFAHCVKESRAHRLLRAILDVTIAYETTIPENEVAFMEGRMPTGKNRGVMHAFWPLAQSLSFSLSQRFIFMLNALMYLK